jgi:hypothetical protein
MEGFGPPSLKGIMEKVKKNNKVIILGTASSLARTPWGRTDYDYWACSPVLSYDLAFGKKIDTVFEMHQRQHWDTESIKKMLSDFIRINPESKVFMQKQYTEIDGSIEYPLQDVQDFVKHEKLGKYLTSTIAMMVALAVMYEYERIELWGCHMSSTEEEYSKQRACVEAWLNYGLGKGINYWLTPESEVMSSKYIYGYEQQKDVEITLLQFKEGLAAAKRELDKDEQKAHDANMEQSGALKMIDKLIKALIK